MDEDQKPGKPPARKMQKKNEKKRRKITFIVAVGP